MVDYGIHYTKEANLSRIHTDGLLTKEEQIDRGIQSMINGSAYGLGVYTADNPGTFYGQHYGMTGLVVLRLKGVVGTNGGSNRNIHSTVDRPQPGNNMVVLKRSPQWAPVRQFDGRMIHRKSLTCTAASTLFGFCTALQKLVDAFLNHNGSVNNSEERKSIPLIPVLQPLDGCRPALLGTILYLPLVVLLHSRRKICRKIMRQQRPLPPSKGKCQIVKCPSSVILYSRVKEIHGGHWLSHIHFQLVHSARSTQALDFSTKALDV